jgi:hypothetical protein
MTRPASSSYRPKLLLAVYLMIVGMVPYGLLFGQRIPTRIETGEYQMRIEKNISKQSAEDICIQRAKLDAITKAFGTLLSQDNSTYIQNKTVGEESKTDTKYSYISNSFVNGEWIEDIGQPIVHYQQNGNEDWIQVTIKGKIREIKANPVTFKASLLSCEKANCVATEFNNKQDFYLYFKSPHNGYLSVYMDIPQEGMTYRLLPYKKSGSEACIEVKGDEEYIFFSPQVDKVCEHPKSEVDQFFFELNNKEIPESHHLIVLFSPEAPLEKPILSQSPITSLQQRLKMEKYDIPSYLEGESFQKWLQAYRSRNQGIQLLQMYVNIH